MTIPTLSARRAPSAGLATNPVPAPSFEAVALEPSAAVPGISLALQWQDALREARLTPADPFLSCHLLELASWPNLTRLPPEIAGPTARVCALLWRKRTAGLLVARVLNLPSDEVQLLLQVLRRFGHVRPARALDIRPETRVCEALPASESPEAVEAPRPLRPDSLLSKFWQRLTAGHP